MMKDDILKWIPIVILPLLAILVLRKFILPGSRKRLPPGPSPLPIVGNLIEILTPLPHRKLRDLSLNFGPLMYIKLGQIPTIVVSTPDMAKQVLKTNDNVFANRPQLAAPKLLGYNYTDIAFAPYGDYWRQMRKICVVELLNSKRVNAFRVEREEEVALMVKSIAGQCSEPISLVELMFEMSFDSVSRTVFGKKFDDQKRFRTALKTGTSLAAGFFVGDFFPSLGFIGKISGMEAKLRKTFVELDGLMNRLIQEVIQEKEKQVSDGSRHHEYLIDALLRLKDNGNLHFPLTLDNIKSICLDFITGGSENSSNSIEWAMTEMMKSPRILKKAQDEVRQVIGGKGTVEEGDLQKLNYIKLVLKETFRLHPPVPFLIPRESLETCTINGYEIPAKTRTIINCWAISRDPSSWKDPEIFKPERFQDNPVDFTGKYFEFIPFGAGRRICPGITMGMLNLELAFASLLYHFDWKLPDGVKPEDIDMNETFGLTLFKTSNLYLVPTLHVTEPNQSPLPCN